MSISTGDVIATGALVLSAGALAVSVWSVLVTKRFNRRQIAFERTAEQLNQLLIEKEALENQAQRRAEISVSTYRLGNSDTRLKVFNRGKATARNVTIEEVGDASLLMPSEIARKFPAPMLEPHGMIELMVVRHLSSPSRTEVLVGWDDDSGQGHSKPMAVTL